MKGLRARSRCTSPASRPFHSSASMMRGITSKGQARSMPRPSEYTVKVMPMARMSRSARSWRACSSEVPSGAEVADELGGGRAGRAVRLEELVPGADERAKRGHGHTT